MSPFQLSLSLTCWWTGKLSSNLSPMQGALPRYIFLTFWLSSQVSSLSDGSWQVCGHLSTSPLQHHHEAGTVCLLSSWVLVPLLYPHLVSHPPLGQILCVWTVPSQLLLWPHCPPEVELFRHLPQWVGHLYCGRNPFHPAFESILGLSILTGTSFLRISSTKRLFKVFSTSVTHLFVVYLYYSILASVYFFSSSWDSDDKNTIASIMYAVVQCWTPSSTASGTEI